MNINDIKDLCNEHTELLRKTKIIDDCNKEHYWMSVTTPDNQNFFLTDEEIKLLENYHTKRGVEIENIIHNLLDKS